MSWWIKQSLMAEAGDDGAAGGTGSVVTGAGDAGATGAAPGAGTVVPGESAGATTGDQGTGDSKTIAPNWPSDWREKYAGGDEKKLTRLARYASPEAALDAMIAAQNRISSGELRSSLPKDATAEQITAWRTENGIPESPDKYDLTLDNGLTIGENDKPIIDGFLAKAHDANYTPAQAKQAVQWYYEHMQEAQAKVVEETKRVEQQTEDALRAEWGQDFRPNMNAITGLLDMFAPGGDEELRTKIMNGAKQNVGFAKMLAGMALQFNPAGTIIGGGPGGDIGKSIDDEISSIEKVMREKRHEYNRDEKMQERYRKLIEARQRRAA